MTWIPIEQRHGKITSPPGCSRVDSRMPSTSLIHRGVMLAGQQSERINRDTRTPTWQTRVPPSVCIMICLVMPSIMWPVKSYLAIKEDHLDRIAGFFCNWSHPIQVFTITLIIRVDKGIVLLGIFGAVDGIGLLLIT